MDAKAPNADEGRGKLRKAMGSRKQAVIHGCPNGGTRQVEDLTTYDESIVVCGAPGELKHLSTRRKRNQNEIP